MKLSPDGFPPLSATPGRRQIVRKARLTLAERIERSFAEAGSRMPNGLGETIVSYDRTKGYRLGVKAIVR
jgi:hypothetical protein